MELEKFIIKLIRKNKHTGISKKIPNRKPSRETGPPIKLYNQTPMINSVLLVHKKADRQYAEQKFHE